MSKFFAFFPELSIKVIEIPLFKKASSLILLSNIEELNFIEEKISLLSEKTFSLVRAIPKDIKIKNIVAYINRKVVFSTNPGSSKSK